MDKYKFIEDLTSDVMFEAYGKSLKEVFANSAEAMFTVICHIKKVKPEKAIAIEAKAEDAGKLMIAWLQELIAAVDTEAMFFSRFEIQEISEKHVKAKCWGEPVSTGKGGTVVKAVTYYKFLFEKGKSGYKTRVVMDI